MKKYLSTISYILMILFINVGFAYMPMIRVLGFQTSLMDPVAGVVYLVRDFAQQELGHKIFFAMIIGAILSYFLATPAVAIASISAFVAGELIDWSIFTFTKKPLNQRLILSSCISAPVDSFIFLYILGYLNFMSFSLMCLGKIIGVIVIWYGWRLRINRTLLPSQS
jgi:uncharacterized PurR-regulated membrane protein YhhQ (DUF165 family)